MLTAANKTAIQKLKSKRDKLNARIQLAENRHKVTTRKDDTRRKILVGAWYLAEIAQNQSLDELKQQLDSFLTRESDRRLFDLAPKENPEA